MSRGKFFQSDRAGNHFRLKYLEIEGMGPILMVTPRAYTTIRVFSAVGAAVFLIGVVMLALRWRKVSAQIRKAQEAALGPDLD